MFPLREVSNLMSKIELQFSSCRGLNGAFLKRYVILESMNVILFGKRVFEAVIKLWILRWDYFGLWIISLNSNDKCSYQRRHTEEEKTERGRDYSSAYLSQGMLGATEAQRVQGRCSPQFFGENMVLLDIPVLDFCPLELWETKFLS